MTIYQQRAAAQSRRCALPHPRTDRLRARSGPRGRASVTLRPSLAVKSKRRRFRGSPRRTSGSPTSRFSTCTGPFRVSPWRCRSRSPSNSRSRAIRGAPSRSSTRGEFSCWKCCGSSDRPSSPCSSPPGCSPSSSPWSVSCPWPAFSSVSATREGFPQSASLSGGTSHRYVGAPRVSISRPTDPRRDARPHPRVQAHRVPCACSGSRARGGVGTGCESFAFSSRSSGWCVTLRGRRRFTTTRRRTRAEPVRFEVCAEAASCSRGPGGRRLAWERWYSPRRWRRRPHEPARWRSVRRGIRWGSSPWCLRGPRGSQPRLRPSV